MAKNRSHTKEADAQRHVGPSTHNSIQLKMFTNDQITQQMTIAEAAALDAEFLPLVTSMREVAAGRSIDSAAAAIPAEVMPGLADKNSEVILVSLPARANEALPEMLSGKPDVMNIPTDDLLKCDTFLCFSGKGLELRLSSWRGLCGSIDTDESLMIVVVSGDSVYRRRFVPQGTEGVPAARASTASSEFALALSLPRWSTRRPRSSCAARISSSRTTGSAVATTRARLALACRLTAACASTRWPAGWVGGIA